MAMDPPLFLKDGDKVRIEISEIGVIENDVRNEVAQTLIA
jgi:2-keto-4-pentenoate hydratase/2-oxohepta-3-ene-1,7-dioic acid hydratase in catechol pathway